MKREDVYKVIDSERDYQNQMWSPSHITDGVPADVDKQVAHFIVYMDDYMRKAKEQFAGYSGDRGALENLRKVVALGVACFERWGVPERQKKVDTLYNSGTVTSQGSPNTATSI